MLELVGDIKHVDDAPPENVLFVCKLNPVTTEEDLQIIVSFEEYRLRYDKYRLCEVSTLDLYMFNGLKLSDITVNELYILSKK